MQILLANAKIMFDRADRAAVSKPLFQSVAEMLAAEKMPAILSYNGQAYKHLFLSTV